MCLVVFVQLKSSWQQGAWGCGNSGDLPCQSVVGTKREKEKEDNDLKLKRKNCKT